MTIALGCSLIFQAHSVRFLPKICSLWESVFPLYTLVAVSCEIAHSQITVQARQVKDRLVEPSSICIRSLADKLMPQYGMRLLWNLLLLLLLLWVILVRPWRFGIIIACLPVREAERGWGKPRTEAESVIGWFRAKIIRVQPGLKEWMKELTWSIATFDSTSVRHKPKQATLGPARDPTFSGEHLSWTTNAFPWLSVVSTLTWCDQNNNFLHLVDIVI